MNRTILRTERNLAHVMHELSGIKLDPNHPMQVVISEYKPSRSLAQNRLYWMWMRQISDDYAESGGDIQSPEVWSEYFKRLFLGMERHSVQGIGIQLVQSTTELSIKEFAGYLEMVDMFSAEELAIVLQHPQDIYAEAMG